MFPVKSGLLARYGYDPDTREMDIEFKSGGTWRYRGVSMDLFLGFMESESKGKYFLANIKGKFRDVKHVAADEPAPPDLHP